jgi:transcriptional regulator with GAF, ATPase, and Fis domain
VVFADSDEITQRHLIPLIEPEESGLATEGPSSLGRLPREPSSSHFPPDHPVTCLCVRCNDGVWPTWQECEYRLIRATLEHTHFNQSAAARLLGVDRRLLARKIRKLGIHPAGLSRPRPLKAARS